MQVHTQTQTQTRNSKEVNKECVVERQGVVMSTESGYSAPGQRVLVTSPPSLNTLPSVFFSKPCHNPSQAGGVGWRDNIRAVRRRVACFEEEVVVVVVRPERSL